MIRASAAARCSPRLLVRHRGRDRGRRSRRRRASARPRRSPASGSSLISLPGLALLGAGLTPAALGSRGSAAMRRPRPRDRRPVRRGRLGDDRDVHRDEPRGRDLRRCRHGPARQGRRHGRCGPAGRGHRGGPGLAADRRAPRSRGSCWSAAAAGRRRRRSVPISGARAPARSAGGSVGQHADARRRGGSSPGRSTSPQHAEHQVLAVDEAAVVLDRAERVEVALRRCPGRGSSSRSAASGCADAQDRLAEPDPAADPGVLLVRLAALELDQHPEPAGVDVADAEHCRASAASEPSVTRRGRVARPRPAGPVAADDPDRRDRRSRRQRLAPTGPRRCDRRPVRPWIGVSMASPSRTSSSTTVPSGNVSRRIVASGSVCAATWTIAPAISWSTSRFGLVDDEEPPVLEDAALGRA